MIKMSARYNINREIEELKILIKNKEANEAFFFLLKIKIGFWYKHKIYMRGGHLSLFLSFSFTESGQNILRMSSVCVCVCKRTYAWCKFGHSFLKVNSELLRRRNFS